MSLLAEFGVDAYQTSPKGEQSDVDMAVNQAMESDAVSDMFGMEMASDEEHVMLKEILDSVEMAIHGSNSGKVEEILKNAPSAFEGVASAAHVLTVASYMQANKQGLNPSPDLYFAENGVIQTTTELVWEFAEAMGIEGVEDDAQFEAALFDTYRRIGDTVMEEENPAIHKSAQELMIEMETGEPFNSDDPIDGPMDNQDPIADMGNRIPAYEMQQGPGVADGPSEAPRPQNMNRRML